MAEMGIKQRDLTAKLPKAVPVKNKQPAAKQMTAEQLLREARHMQVRCGLRCGAGRAGLAVALVCVLPRAPRGGEGPGRLRA